MKIYDAIDPMSVLWELFKDLDIPVYKDINDVTDDVDICLVIRADIVNSGRIYGDGQTHIRRSNCDINLLARNKSPHSDSDFAINCNKVKELLDGAELPYTGYDLGYNDSLKASEYSWSVNILYG